MTPCFFLQSYESPQIEPCLAVLKTVGLSVQTYSFSANETGGSRGPPRASEAGGGGLPPAMLALTESLRFSDCQQDTSYFFFSPIISQREKTSRSLTFAPRCPVGRFVPAARVNSPPGERVGTNRLTVRELPSPYRHPFEQLPSPE